MSSKLIEHHTYRLIGMRRVTRIKGSGSSLCEIDEVSNCLVQIEILQARCRLVLTRTRITPVSICGSSALGPLANLQSLGISIRSMRTTAPFIAPAIAPVKVRGVRYPVYAAAATSPGVNATICQMSVSLTARNRRPRPTPTGGIVPVRRGKCTL